jgi:hypothetical protein
VVLASDGLYEPGIGVADPEAEISHAVHEAARAGSDAARALARGVVERALAVQRTRRSGDNVAAAVLWLGWGPGDHQSSTPLHLPEDPQDGGD